MRLRLKQNCAILYFERKNKNGQIKKQTWTFLTVFALNLDIAILCLQTATDTRPDRALGSLGQPRAASAHVRLSYFETNLDKEVSVQAAAASSAAFPLSSCNGPVFRA